MVNKDELLIMPIRKLLQDYLTRNMSEQELGLWSWGNAGYKLEMDLYRVMQKMAKDELAKRYKGKEIEHPTPCDDCGSKRWIDWVLLPHEIFNSVCPGGNGYLCFPCFIKRASKSFPGKCFCENIDFQTYGHSVRMKPPFKSGWESGDGCIPIDICIATEIAELWHKGIVTLGSCCGHGKKRASVIVMSNKNLEALGYKEWAKVPSGLREYYLKTGTQNDK